MICRYARRSSAISCGRSHKSAPSRQLCNTRDAALVAAEASGQTLLIAEALDHLCMAHCFAGDNIDPDLLDRAMRLDDQVGVAPPADHPAIASGRLTLALTLKWTDNFDEARTLLGALRTEHIEHGDEAALTPVLFHLGELECWSGDVAAADRLAKEVSRRRGPQRSGRRGTARDDARRNGDLLPRRPPKQSR